MSCATLTQQPTKFVVSVGQLPEGFCGTQQQLAQAIADRLIVQLQNNLSSFATGPIAPTSNIGPWLKNCEEWFVFNDDLGVYVPIRKGGFSFQSYFTTSGTFTVPDSIYRLKIQAWGGGGGGGDPSGGGQGGGGGGGGYCSKIVDVNPGDLINYVVGTGGSHGAPATDGANSTILTLVAGGGKGAAGGATSEGGAGGTSSGGDINLSGGCGAYGQTGPGGDSPLGGIGGVLSATAGKKNGTSPGGGGGGTDPGAALGTAGNGSDGAILIEW